MISRREKLLIRPWEQRKYENHRRKVQTALPAIDNKPPASRDHVTLKLKKKQKENERCDRIQQENFLLLQKMNDATRMKRIDNCWSTPLPKKVSLYNIVEQNYDEEEIEPEMYEKKNVFRDRRHRCCACSPKNDQRDENRYPPKRRSRSVPARKPSHLPPIKEQISSASSQNTKSRQTKLEQTPSILLKRGCLELSVNFPMDTFVKIHDGVHEKILQPNYCGCKNNTSLLTNTDNM